MTRPQCSNVQNIISELDGYWGAFIVDMYIIHIMTYYYYDILCITYHDNKNHRSNSKWQQGKKGPTI